ncbi:uncharacterized protein troap [Antennarius striatus]|uniref:uncharacterized protein troap n=1 Tax=Antennarius striatus TaxID=241820 RepID=UPI0035B31D87
MDSSPILRQQSQNKTQCGFQRMKNEHNKIPSHPKSFTTLSVSQPFKQHSENKDPGNSEIARKAPVTPGISRLPVLAKSRCPQMPSDFSQSHCRWEEKPLAGKAKKKKPCTRPIPFNLSQSRSSRIANENLQRRAVLQPRTVAKVVQSVNNARLKTSNTDVKPTKCPATLGSSVSSNKGAKMSDGKATDNRSQLPGHSGPSSTFNTLSHPLSSIPNNALSQNTTTSAQNVFNTEACLDNMNLLSLKDPTKTSHANQNTLPTVQGNLSKSATAVSSISDKGETFKLDHAALLSILRNEGVGATVLEPATPQSNAYNYLPQRVSVMKSHQKAVLATGPVRFVQFSPDSTTIQSILQNEGLKDGGLLSVTPKSSACPPGRSTSIYTAQRVPVRKNLAEVTGGPIGELKETPLLKWTPQRVRSTRRQPMSAMKWHLSTQPLPYVGTPGLQSCKGSLHQCQEEVVQRLFDDQEDDQCKEVTEKDLETQGEQQPAQSALIHSPSEEEVETSTDSNNEKKQMPVRLQPFIQAPERESVIFFSTGKKLLRGPRFEQQENCSDDKQQCSSEQRKVPSTHKETSEMSELTCQINPPVPSLHRDSTAQKSCGLSSAVMMLRKRFPPLEELRMDEEVASYTSMTVSAAHGFLPPRPRCGNPVASALHFEETTRFVPVVPDLPSESSPPSSPLQER